MIYQTSPEFVREANILFEEIAIYERNIKEKKERLNEIIKPKED